MSNNKTMLIKCKKCVLAASKKDLFPSARLYYCLGGSFKLHDLSKKLADFTLKKKFVISERKFQ